MWSPEFTHASGGRPGTCRSSRSQAGLARPRERRLPGPKLATSLPYGVKMSHGSLRELIAAA
jgi:hypothetical protein